MANKLAGVRMHSQYPCGFQRGGHYNVAMRHEVGAAADAAGYR
jgi:hypothetical protein